MMSMNCRPPRAMLARKLLMFPAANARVLKRLRRNIGSGTRRSTQRKMASRSAPPTSMPITSGLPQPMDEFPYGSMPYVMPSKKTVNPMAKVILPAQSTCWCWRIVAVSRSIKNAHQRSILHRRKH